MAENKNILGTIADRLIKLAAGFQAQPEATLGANGKPIKGLTTVGMPTMHRFLNVIGMVAGFVGIKYIADIMYGQKINGSQYEEIPREKVPAILRPLHGIIKSNPHSDKPRDQWLTVLHKMLPGVGGAAGAIAGSSYFFAQNGTVDKMANLAKESNIPQNVANIKTATQAAYKQGILWRIGAGMTAWLSSVSGLTGMLYGTCLNHSFWLVNGAKTMATGIEEFLKKKIPITKIKIINPANRSKIALAEIGSIGAVIGSAIGIGAMNRSRKTPGATEADPSSLTAKEYVDITNKEHAQEKKKGFVNGALLNAAKGISDVALAVFPTHRFWSATGLLAGATAGMMASRFLQGKVMPNSASWIPRILKSVEVRKVLDEATKKMVDHPGDLRKNALLKLGGDYIFAAACALGVMTGSNHAYKSADKKNEKDNSIEGALARARAHQGKALTPGVALTSIFGSASGTYLEPPLSYGNFLMAKTVSMQDRYITTPGLKWMTGTTGSHYFGLREGVDYTIKYAVRNPDEKPEQFEALAHTILGPVAHAAGIELKGENIKKFTDKINDIRSKYWVEGGVPPERQAEFTQELKQHLTGPGLDKTLLESGIDVMNMDLKKVGGGFGWFAGLLGANKKIAREQENLRALVTEWRSKSEGVSQAAQPPATEDERTARSRYEQKAIPKEDSKKVAFSGSATTQSGASRLAQNSTLHPALSALNGESSAVGAA